MNKKIKNYLVYSTIVFVGCGLLYWIFAPSNSDNTIDNVINKSLPEPEDKELPAKESAYLVDDHNQNISDMFSGLEDDVESLSLDKITDKRSSNTQEEEIVQALEKSKQIQQDASKIVLGITNTIATANSGQREKEEEKQKQLEELQEKVREQEAQLKVAQVQAELKNLYDNTGIIEETSAESSEQPMVMPVSSAEKNIVSSLNQETRNRGFYGFSGINTEQRNTIKAVIFGKQIITHGQNLRLRLSEPMQIGQRVMPANSIIIAKCQIEADRLIATVTNIEYQGILTPVSLEVYDAADGQPGLNLPGSLEQEAIKEIGAEVATSVGSATSQSVAVWSSEPNAAEQIKTDLGRGIISGVSKFASRKLMEIKVTVQDRHRVFLVTKK